MKRLNQSGLTFPVALGIVGGLIVVGLLIWWMFAPEDAPESPASTQPTTQSNQPSENTENETPEPGDGQTITVTYTNDGFSPDTVSIKQGDTVRFVNESDNDFWPASDDHPSHTIYPEFDANNEIGPGGSYSFTFDQVGTWGYHNHENHTDEGTVVVEE